MPMPFHAGALLPEQERYLDRQFRTFAVRFKARSLDYDDACVLAAFLAIVPITHAAHIFRWDKYGIRAAKSVVRWYTEPAREMIQANLKAMDVDDGLAVVQAMREGGWTGGALPEISVNALREAKHRGMSVGQIMKATGLSRGSVVGHVYGHYDHSGRRAAAVGALVL